jgi:hypothetical protein
MVDRYGGVLEKLLSLSSLEGSNFGQYKQASAASEMVCPEVFAVPYLWGSLGHFQSLVIKIL